MIEKLYAKIKTGCRNWEEFLTKKAIDVNRFNLSINNITLKSRVYEEGFKKLKGYVTKSKKSIKLNYKIDSFNITGSTSTSKTLRVTGFGLFVQPIPAAVGCGIAIGLKKASEFLKEKKDFSLK